MTVEEVERLEVDREGQSPLLLTATRGAGSGAQGKRLVRLEGGVTVSDDDAGLGLEIPTVEIDQVGGWVRSLGAVRLKNDAWTGTRVGGCVQPEGCADGGGERRSSTVRMEGT